MHPDESFPSPIHIFYSYAQEDESLLKELEKHLSALKREENIISWDSRNISAGTEWSSEIDKNLNTANIILLIISANFLASDYCYDVEMPQALARHEAKEARVIPIIACPVNIQRTPFSKLQALPSNGLPISKWVTQDDAFVDIVQGIRKVVGELRAVQTKKRPSLPARSNPFLFNQPLSDPKEFYGRVRERETLLNRTWHAASTSIVGPRRIGKTWLMHYVRLIAPQELGSRHLIGYLDAKARRCATVVSFVAVALQALGLQNRLLETGPDSLILLEQAVEEVSSMGRTPILCIDEFEHFGNHSEFDLDFFSSLRAMTQTGLCLLVASKTPLIDIVGEPGKTSGFFNVFRQITLKPFDQKEAELFIREKGEIAGLTAQECEKLLQYGQYKEAYWPISLQLAGETLVEDKTLTQRYQDLNYYRPTEQTYWKEFEDRLQEVYRGMMK